MGKNTLHLNKTLKNDTCIEFRRDIKALALLADTSSSGNLLHSWTTWGANVADLVDGA